MDERPGPLEAFYKRLKLGGETPLSMFVTQKGKTPKYDEASCPCGLPSAPTHLGTNAGYIHFWPEGRAQGKTRLMLIPYGSTATFSEGNWPPQAYT